MDDSRRFEELMRQVAEYARQLEDLERQFQGLGDVEIAISLDEIREELGTSPSDGSTVFGGLRA